MTDRNPDPEHAERQAQRAAENFSRAERLMSGTDARLRRHPQRRAFHEGAMFRREMRQSGAEMARAEEARIREDEEDRQAEQDTMDHVGDEVLAMIADGWTAAELADVGIGPALLRQLGITPDAGNSGEEEGGPPSSGLRPA